MKTFLLVILSFLYLSDTAFAGILFGRIVDENGKSLARSELVFEGTKTKTNEFGGYKLTLPDGERKLKVTIDNVPYESEMIRIYSPETKQNWKMNRKTKQLTKIR